MPFRLPMLPLCLVLLATTSPAAAQEGPYFVTYTHYLEEPGNLEIPYEPIADLRRAPAHEVEGKVILSSVAGVWNVSQNLIFEKNLSAAEGVEFGYSLGISRPIGTLASGSSCHLCAENFVAGLEAYGGLGSTISFSGGEQRHYIAPVLAWHVTDHSTVRASVGVGLTESSDPLLVRVGWSYELALRRRPSNSGGK